MSIEGTKNSLSPGEYEIKEKRLYLKGGDKKSIALASEILTTRPKDNLWNKILKFLGVGYWTVLTVKNQEDTLTYVKVNGNSLRKFAGMDTKTFKKTLANNADLDMTKMLKREDLPTSQKPKSKDIVGSTPSSENQAPTSSVPQVPTQSEKQATPIPVPPESSQPPQSSTPRITTSAKPTSPFRERPPIEPSNAPPLVKINEPGWGLIPEGKTSRADLRAFNLELKNKFQNSPYAIFIYRSMDTLLPYNRLPIKRSDAKNFIKNCPQKTAVIGQGENPGSWTITFKDSDGKVGVKSFTNEMNVSAELDIFADYLFAATPNNPSAAIEFEELKLRPPPPAFLKPPSSSIIDPETIDKYKNAPSLDIDRNTAEEILIAANELREPENKPFLLAIKRKKEEGFVISFLKNGVPAHALADQMKDQYYRTLINQEYFLLCGE